METTDNESKNVQTDAVGNDEASSAAVETAPAEPLCDEPLCDEAVPPDTDGKTPTEDEAHPRHPSYRILNARIRSIGLWYDCDTNTVCCRMYFTNLNGFCTIDMKSVCAFVSKVYARDTEVAKNGGAFIENLNNTYVRVIVDDSMTIVGFMHIIDDTCVFVFDRK